MQPLISVYLPIILSKLCCSQSKFLTQQAVPLVIFACVPPRVPIMVLIAVLTSCVESVNCRVPRRWSPRPDTTEVSTRATGSRTGKAFPSPEEVEDAPAPVSTVLYRGYSLLLLPSTKRRSTMTRTPTKALN